MTFLRLTARLLGNLVILAVALILFVIVWPACALMDLLD